MKFLEFSFSLPNNQQLFSFRLYFEWISFILLKIYIFVLSQAQSRQHTRIPSCGVHHWISSLTSSHKSTLSSEAPWSRAKIYTTCWTIIPLTDTWNRFVASGFDTVVWLIWICSIPWLRIVALVPRSRNIWYWGQPSCLGSRWRWKVSCHLSFWVRTIAHEIISLNRWHRFLIYF